MIANPIAFGRKRSLVPIALSLMLIGLGAIRCSLSERAETPERIILIVVDTLRRDHVSAYAAVPALARPGKPNRAPKKAAPGPVRTPNIDRLAASGQIFSNAVSAYHATTMTMAALFTGRTPSIESGAEANTLEWNSFAACGMSRFARPGGDDACIPDSLDTLAEDLRSAGYWTLGVVSNGLLYRPAGYDQGFDQWVEVGLPAPGQKLDIFAASPIRTARHVNLEVAAALAKRPSDRFFLYVHYLDVHDWNLFSRGYTESVEFFDRKLGDLLDLLAAENLLENTTILLTSDHGEMLVDEHLGLKARKHFGNPSFQPVLEVPLIVTPPIEADTAEMIRSQDIRGMIGRIAGLDGEPAPDLEPDEHFVSEMHYQTYRKGRWKSIWKRTGAKPMLFDLAEDPGENSDLAAQRVDLLLEHRERIDEISRALASDDSHAAPLTEENIDRLRALGYLETTKHEFWNRTDDSEGTDADDQP